MNTLFLISFHTYLFSPLSLLFTTYFHIIAYFNTIVNRPISFRAVLSNRTICSDGNMLCVCAYNWELSLGNFLFLPLFICSLQFPNARDFRIYSSCVVGSVSSFPLRMVILLVQPSITLCLETLGPWAN